MSDRSPFNPVSAEQQRCPGKPAALRCPERSRCRICLGTLHTCGGGRTADDSGVLDVEEDAAICANLNWALNIKNGKTTGNFMFFNMISASTQLTENVTSGIRDYIMQKHHSEQKVDEQHKRIVDAIEITGPWNRKAVCESTCGPWKTIFWK